MSDRSARLVFVGIAALLAVFFFWPAAEILRGGFFDADGRFTLAYLRSLLADPAYRSALSHSLELAGASTLLALFLGVPLAASAQRWEFPGKRFLTPLVLLPLILPPFVGAIGLRQVFGRHGALNALIAALSLRPAGWSYDWLGAHRLAAVVLIDGFSLFPIVYLNAAAALANVDPALEEAAENLGCVGWRRFRRVTLPLIRPGLFAGATLVFIWAFTDLGTPLILDYPAVTSVQVYYGLHELAGNPLPYALVAIMLGVSLACYAAGKGFFGQAGHAMAAKAAGPRRMARLGGARGWLCAAGWAGVVLLALAPHLGVAGIAFSRDWYGTVAPRGLTLENFRLALGHALTVPAIGNSLKFAAAAAAIDLVLGLAAAYVVARSNLSGRGLLDFLVMMPLAMPGLVLAFGYLAMAQPGRLLHFLDPVDNPTALLIAAYAVRRLPYVTRAAASGLEQTSVTLEEAARNLGCPPLRAALRVTLPLIAANLAAGGLLAFAFSMLEVSDSVVLAQKQAYYPITKAILELYQLLGDGKFLASALGLWEMVFLGAAVAAAAVFLGKRMGALFRV